MPLDDSPYVYPNGTPTWSDAYGSNPTPVGGSASNYYSRLDPSFGNRGAQGLQGPGSAVTPMPAFNTPQYDWWSAGQLGNYASRTAPSPAASQLPNMFGNIYRGIEAMYGPQLAQEQAQLAQTQWFNALKQQGFNDQEAAMRAKYAADLGMLDIGKADNAILLQALGRQPDYLNKLRDLDLKDLNLQSDRALRQNKSSYTARGAMFTPGFGRDMFDIQSGRWLGTERINTRTNEELAQVGDRKRQLENQAKSYGMQADQLRTALQQGLTALNLDRVMSVGDLVDMADSPTGRQIMQEAINLWNQSLATGVMPQFPGMGSNSGVSNRQLTPIRGPQ